jgi:hypothetical protein
VSFSRREALLITIVKARDLGTGIGLSAAEAIAALGANLAIVGRSQTRTRIASARIRGGGREGSDGGDIHRRPLVAGLGAQIGRQGAGSSARCTEHDS